MRIGLSRVGAALVGLLSILAAGWSVAWQLDDVRLFNTLAVAQTAPLPDGVALPDGARQFVLTPLTAAQRGELADTMWRDPLNARPVNLFYADAIRTDRPLAEVRRLSRLLARLGWRYTPAQQNLLIRAVLDERFGEVVDRVDALLRRQKLAALSYTVLATMESIPQVHARVLRKLAVQPGWRRDYLSVINPQSAPVLLDARARTLAALLATPAGLSREEMAPSLTALAASGRGRIAHDLWTRHADRGENGNLVLDPRFRQAVAVAGDPDLGIPFEWHLAQNLGYNVQASADGAVINWDRRGVPIFLVQTVPIRPGVRYLLTMRGSTDSATLQRLLAPALTCGQDIIRFEAIGDPRSGEARYRSPIIPSGCDMGTLAIGGGLDTGSGGVNIIVSHVVLQADRQDRAIPTETAPFEPSSST